MSTDPGVTQGYDIGTAAERAALFDALVMATARRQAIAPAKRALFAMAAPESAMLACRGAMVAAASPADLFYALTRLSNARHDRHLRLRPVADGLPFPEGYQATVVDNYADLASRPAPVLPLRLATDFGDPDRPSLFVADIADNFSSLAGTATPPAGGDLLLGVNGAPLADYAAVASEYLCHSTPAFFWFHLPGELVRRSPVLPGGGDRTGLRLALQGAAGDYDLYVPFVDPALPVWGRPTRPDYPNFHHSFASRSVDLWRHAARRTVLQRWHGFGPTLVADVDALMDHAATAGLLDHDVIIDATRARGGDFGGYALACLAGRPFRTTFGDLRPSDAIPPLLRQLREQDDAALASGALHPRQVAAIGWRRDWFATVEAAIAAGATEIRPVPFKCAHQPADGDGLLHPAALHFSGRLACLSLPCGGSHVDQFVAQLLDNGLAHGIGLPPGGFSKTWTYEETVYWPGTSRPVVAFMWSCGNTIRPNGEVLEGNPAVPAERFAPTRGNHTNYLALAVQRALAYFDRDGENDHVAA